MLTAETAAKLKTVSNVTTKDIDFRELNASGTVKLINLIQGGGIEATIMLCVISPADRYQFNGRLMVSSARLISFARGLRSVAEVRRQPEADHEHGPAGADSDDDDGIA